MQDWTDPDQQRAVLEGWRLADVVDNGQSHLYLMILPTDKRFKNSTQASSLVIERARAGSVFHQRALSVATLSRLRPGQKRGK